MEYFYQQQLKVSWGDDKPCNHPHLEKVYNTGAFLTNYACTHCGKEFTIAQKMELYQERKKKLSKSL
jgi:transposase-like protein